MSPSFPRPGRDRVGRIARLPGRLRPGRLAVLAAALAVAVALGLAWRARAAEARVQLPEAKEAICQERLPFLFACVALGVLSALAGGLLAFMAIVSDRAPNIAGGQTRSGRRFVAAKMCFLMGFVTFLEYLYIARDCGELLLLVVPRVTGAPHIGLRNLIWLFCTPLQWHSFAHACCDVSPGEIRRLVATAVVAQVSGAMMLVVSDLLVWTSLFVLASAAFYAMLRLAVELPLLKDFEFLARLLLRAELLLWILYPTARSVRLAGWIGTQTEQILVLSILDSCMTLVLMVAILASHIHMLNIEAYRALIHVRSIVNGMRSSSPLV